MVNRYTIMGSLGVAVRQDMNTPVLEPGTVLVLAKDYDNLQAQLTAQAATIKGLMDDKEAACGELMVSMEEAPIGSLVAKLVIANRVLRSERSNLQATIKGLEEQLRQANSQEESAKDMPYEGSPLENIRLKQALAEALAQLEKYRVNAEKYVTPRVWKSDGIEVEGWVISHEEATGIRTAMKALAEAQEMVNTQKMYLQSKDNEITRLGNASATLQAEKRDLNTAIDQLQLTIKRLSDSLARVTEEQQAARDAVQGSEQESFNLRQRLATLTAALGPFGSGGEWGKWKAWMVEGAPSRQEGIEAAKVITHCQAQADTALALPDAGPGVKGEVMGTVEVMYPDDKTACVCCPNGRHAIVLTVMLDSFEHRYPAHFRQDAALFVNEHAARHEHIGKRVRITVEVLDAIPGAAEGGA